MALLALGALALPACSGNEQQPLERTQKIAGKVTYKGRPVLYGKVLLYSHGRSIEVKTGRFVPTAFGDIRDGKYEIPNAPLGHAMVCVATDPDADLLAFLKPAALGGGGAPLQGGFPGGPGKDPFPPKEAPKGLLFKDDNKKGPPPPPIPGGGGPGGFPGAGPPGGPPSLPFNPLTVKFSDEEKKTLREIHAKYGIAGRTPLSWTIKETAGVQTFDLKLK